MGSIHISKPIGVTPTTWSSGVWYAKDRQVVNSNGDMFIAHTGHLSAAATEPGIGVDTATVWTVSNYGMTANQNAAMNTATALDATHPPLVKDSDTTAGLADSTDRRYCTDAQKTVIGNTSGTNTGDETAARIAALLEYATVVAAEAATGGADNNLYYVVENETWYRYESAGSAFTRDGTFVLNTGAGGDTRLLAIGGKYNINNLNTLGSAIVTKASADAVGASIGGKKSRGTSAVPVVVTTGDVLSEFYGEGFDGSNSLKMGAIQIVSEGTIASTRVPTRLVFYTATDATPSVLTEHFRIDSTGMSTFTTSGSTYPVLARFTNSQNPATWDIIVQGSSATGGGGLLKLVSSNAYPFAIVSGNVYISTLTGSAKFHVYDNTTTAQPVGYFEQDNSGNSNVVFKIRSDGTGDIFQAVDGTTTVFSVADGGGASLITNELVEAATIGLTAAKCMNTIVNNYGQANDITYTLPAAAKGLAFTFIAGTTVAKYVRFDPNASEVIYLNGTALAGGAYIGIASIVAGMRVKFECFQTGASAYAWRATTLDAFASE